MDTFKSQQLLTTAQALFPSEVNSPVQAFHAAGGLPVGAYSRRREIMQRTASFGLIVQASTHSGHPLTLSAGFLSTAHGGKEADLSIQAAERAFQKLSKKI
jgi:glutamate-1-semialdehyde aminotransferase